MKLPICQKDAQSKGLCKECEKKLEENEINQTDIELSRILYNLNKKETILDEVDLLKTKQLDEELLLALVKGNPAALIGKGGRIIRLISEKLGKKVRIVKDGTVIQVANDLMTPTRAYGINTLYRSDGEIKKKITVPHEERRKIKLTREKTEKALKIITGEEYTLKFV